MSVVDPTVVPFITTLAPIKVSLVLPSSTVPRNLYCWAVAMKEIRIPKDTTKQRSMERMGRRENFKGK